MLIALDPGRGGFGWAVFNGRHDLLACGVVQSPKPVRDFQQVPLVDVAAHVHDTLEKVLHLHRFAIFADRRAVVERMVHYPATQSGAKPQSDRLRTAIANDLLDLQAIGNLVAGALCPLRNVTQRAARDWKGGTKTEVLEARLLDPLSPLLRVPERDLLGNVRPLGLRHNAVDAVAMGLSELGRVRWV